MLNPSKEWLGAQASANSASSTIGSENDFFPSHWNELCHIWCFKQFGATPLLNSRVYWLSCSSSSCTSTVPQFFEIFCKNNASNDSTLLLIPYTAMVQFLQEVPMHKEFSFLLSLILTWRKNFRNPTRTLWLSFAQKLPKQHWLSWGEKLCINHVIEHFNSYCPPDLTLYCAWEKICLNHIMEHFDLNFTTYSISSSIEDWHWLCKKTPSPLPEHILVSFWIFCFLGLFPLALW